MRNILTRSWMHTRLWANDPDCLLARQSRTKLTLPEVQSLATVIALSGGAVFLSDDMEQLARERLDLVSSLLPAIPEAAVVRDLLRESMPSTMELGIQRPFESWSVVARFNWSGRRQDIAQTLPPGRWHVFEFWERQYLGVHEHELTLERVPAHGVWLLALRKVIDKPQVIGSTFHYSMGGREIEHIRFDAGRKTLLVDLLPVAKRKGELFVYVSDAYRLVEALLDDGPVSVRLDGPLLIVGLALDKPSKLAFQFV